VRGDTKQEIKPKIKELVNSRKRLLLPHKGFKASVSHNAGHLALHGHNEQHSLTLWCPTSRTAVKLCDAQNAK